MKKIIILLSINIACAFYTSKAQQLELTPTSNKLLKIGAKHSATSPFYGLIEVPDLVIYNRTNLQQAFINLIDSTANEDKYKVSSYISSRGDNSNAGIFNGMQIGTYSLHPVNFFINNIPKMRLNKNGNLGIGVPNSGYDNKDYHKAKIEAYGVGDSSIVYSYYSPFKASILGQAFNAGNNVNNVGIIGVTDGQTPDFGYNIGLLGIPILDPNISLADGHYYGGYNIVKTNNAPNDLYGVYNEVKNFYISNTFDSYGTYNNSYNAGSKSSYGTYNYSFGRETAKAFGTYNKSFTDGIESAYGTYNYVLANNDAYGIYTYAKANGSGKRAFAIYNYIEPNNGPGYGMYNYMLGTGGSRYGIYNDMSEMGDSQNEYGVYNSMSGDGLGDKYGTYNQINRTNGTSYGTYNSITGSGTKVVHLKGFANTITNSSSNTSSTTYGLLSEVNASAGIAYAIYASANGSTTTKYAGYFNGKVQVTGTLSKGGGSFKIDHPLDPENKYLYHSFVESPDMMNVYNGNITTDASGNAIVTLPAYFEALNKDFRYQLTVIGQFSQAIISEKVTNNQFKIKTDKPNVEVSWQITGIRQDGFANANRIPTEVDKPKNEVGTYLYPEALGKPLTKGLNYQIEQEHKNATTVTANDGHSISVSPFVNEKGDNKQVSTPWKTQTYTEMPKGGSVSADNKN